MSEGLNYALIALCIAGSFCLISIGGHYLFKKL